MARLRQNNKIQSLPSTYKHALILLVTQMQIFFVFQFETLLAPKSRQFKTPLSVTTLLVEPYWGTSKSI